MMANPLLVSVSASHLLNLLIYSSKSIYYFFAELGWLNGLIVCPTLMLQVMGSHPGWVIPKTIIKLMNV